MLRFLVLLASAVVILVIYETAIDGHFGNVQWKAGGTPGKITVIVRTSEGKPKPGVKVVTTSDSGNSVPDAYTSAKGIAEINPAEDEVLELKVNGTAVMNKNNDFERWFAPKVGNTGLTFNVVIP